MSSGKLAGPKPTSCITCRQRRKKCDLTRPRCERCLKSGLECLGYGDHKPRPIIHRTSSHVVDSQLQSNFPVVATQAGTPRDSVAADVAKDARASIGLDVDTSHRSASSVLGTGLRYMATRPISNDHTNVSPNLEDFNQAWPQNQDHSTLYRRSPPHRPPHTENSFVETAIRQSRSRMIEFMESVGASIPPSVISTQTVGEAQFLNMINEYQLYRVNTWFMPPPPQVRGPMINRLKSSKMTIWAVYLGLNLFKTLNQDTCGTSTSGYIGWIDNFEQKITAVSKQNSTPKDVADRLMAQLELTYIGFVTIGVPLGYDLLRRALPKFHRLVAGDPNLIVEHPNGNLLVSFPRTLSVPQQELNLFILYDSATAFALGVPHLVEYDFNGRCDPTSHGHQCAHGVPVPLVEIIAQVNSWRTGSRTILDDWQALESRAMAWQPLPLPIEDQDPMVNVGRLAVQESWRYVTLVYIYMGMGGLSSHDSRVQAAIGQIIRLEESVTDISIGMHMLMHYVAVGLGAQHEQQRAIIRERLLALKGKRIWLFRGSEFSQVLDHLWYGVGAGGAPVTWNDYVRSRCAVLPL